jgi:hypothetical protein
MLGVPLECKLVISQLIAAHEGIFAICERILARLRLQPP